MFNTFRRTSLFVALASAIALPPVTAPAAEPVGKVGGGPILHGNGARAGGGSNPGIRGVTGTAPAPVGPGSGSLAIPGTPAVGANSYCNPYSHPYGDRPYCG
jgi:hypothetical protein